LTADEVWPLKDDMIHIYAASEEEKEPKEEEEELIGSHGKSARERNDSK
jgi:hypothetical protein